MIEGPAREVQIFLAEAVPGYRGPERASEALLAPVEFFPVLAKDGFRLIARNSVVCLSVALDDEMGGEMTVEDLAGDQATIRNVEITVCNGPPLTGSMVYLMPEGQRRPLDFLNQADPIVALREADRVHLIRKPYIVDVLER